MTMDAAGGRFFAPELMFTAYRLDDRETRKILLFPVKSVMTDEWKCIQGKIILTENE